RLVLRETKEPVAFLDVLERARWVQHALTVDDIGVLLERLTADAIHAAVTLLVEVVGITRGDALDQRLHTTLVVSIGRANELVVLDTKSRPHVLEARRDFIGEWLWRHVARRRRLLHFLPMLVHADEQVHVVTTQSMVTRNNVGTD